MIPAEQHSTTIMKKVVGRFKEDIPVRNGFAGFFPSETTNTLLVDVEVERDTETIAVDVMRFTEGNRSKRTRHSEHTYEPPFYEELYDFARDEVYMNSVAFGVMNSVGANQAISQNALKNVRSNKKKILRAIRKQQADVLQYGVVTLVNGDSIDYRRKPASMVDLGVGNYWSESGAEIVNNLDAAMRFLRDEGNSTGEEINLIMRNEAMNAFLRNDELKTILNSRRMDRAKIVMPQFDKATGMTFHGQVSAGDFNLNLWTYNEKYKTESGEIKYYLDRENAVIIPNDFQGKTVFGGLPYMRKARIGGADLKVPGVIEKDFLLRAYDDEKTISSTLALSSAPLVIPFTVDKIVTLKVLATV